MPLSIGILGGAGAIASARFHTKLVEEWARINGALTDDDFPEIVHYSRSLGLSVTGLEDRKTVAGKVGEALGVLHGCDVVAVVCNSITPFFPPINKRILTPVRAAAGKLKGVKKAWLLASDSTIRDRIYHNAYPEIEWLIPPFSLTPVIQSSITGVFNLSMQLPDEDTVVLGCTELSTQAGGFIHPKVISPTDEMIKILCNL